MSPLDNIPVLEALLAPEPAEGSFSRAAISSSGITDGPPVQPPPYSRPTQEGTRGITFEYNLAAYMVLPEEKWRIRLRDLDSGNILFESENKGAFVNSSKRFYVRFGIEVWEYGNLVFAHQYDCTGRDVLIQFPIGTLGDVLAWFPYAARFAEVHKCNLICAMSPLIIPLLADAYPDIRFVDHEQLVEQKLHETAYATYCLGLFFDDAENIWQPTDFRLVGLHRTAAYILGVDPGSRHPSSLYPAKPGRSPSLMSALRFKAPANASIGTTRMAGARSSHFSGNRVSG